MIILLLLLLLFLIKSCRCILKNLYCFNSFYIDSWILYVCEQKKERNRQPDNKKKRMKKNIHLYSRIFFLFSLYWMIFIFYFHFAFFLVCFFCWMRTIHNTDDYDHNNDDNNATKQNPQQQQQLNQTKPNQIINQKPSSSSLNKHHIYR